jgi:hypothetical protein
MPEIGLESARVVALIGQCIAASVPEHVRMRLEIQLGLDPCAFDHAGEARNREWGVALAGGRSAGRKSRSLLASGPETYKRSRVRL